ncbi:MAG: HNH endonuclease [Planctomycetes bacterium]|nr:HNH endonuclease [Planctomycetota bacterium]
MPIKPNRFTPSGPVSPAATKRDYSHRPSPESQGYDWSWRKLRTWFVKRHPICETCRAQGRTSVTAEIDHVVPVRVAPHLRLAVSNLRAVCRKCHRAKTARDQVLYPTGQRYAPPTVGGTSETTDASKAPARSQESGKIGPFSQGVCNG